MLDPDTCYAALQARDPRFDGLFFVAVATTGIYCRPICPARTPGKDRCSFFLTAAEADRAGFRACFRCRPELAPGKANVDAVPRLVADAMARIDEGALNDGSVDDLAAELGVTARHLRRAFEEQLGVSPIELAQSRRLALAKQLLHDTSMGLADVAFASGFSSVRRFNDAFRSRFGRTPGSLRREHGDATGALTLKLLARPPFDGERLLAFLRDRAIPGVERVDDGYARIVRAGERWGLVHVRIAEDGLRVELDPALGRGVMRIASRLRVLFDLDARPDAIASALSSDPVLGPLVAKRPGLRVPGAFDPFEAAARAILGQQVSVKAATTLAGRVAERFGAEVLPGWRRFPSAREIAALSTDDIARIGLPGARATTLRDVASAFAVSASPGLVGIRGVGDWTRQYVAMRSRHDPDAFPAGDLGVKKALGLTERQALARSEAWRPWRSYAVMHLWTALSEGDL